MHKTQIMEAPLRTKYRTIDEYHSAFPKEVQELLKAMQATIKQAAPQAEEVISYNMPAFKLKGMLVYYAANKKHIGFYPTSSVTTIFKDELVDYKTSKGAIQFPFGEALPIELVKRIVEFRVNENMEIAKRKMNL
ncbi:MAG: DUF1801 domain-containing protein [Bacteroidales bacterium]|nr:DUF1801 domain-containing protein [Bacteroidales bacterium]